MPYVVSIDSRRGCSIEDSILVNLTSDTLSRVEVSLNLFGSPNHNILGEKTIQSPLKGIRIHSAFRPEVGDLSQGMDPRIRSSGTNHMERFSRKTFKMILNHA